MTTINVPIVTGADDGFWKADEFWAALDNLDVGNAYGAAWNIFLRFDNLTISGTIITAYITLYANESTTLISCNIKGVDAADPAAPTTFAEAIAATRTTAVVPWTVGAHTIDLAYQTPELKTIIQELVNSYTYDGTQALIIYLETDGTDVWSRYKSYDNAPPGPYPAVLHIEYDDGSGVQVVVVTVPANC